jgi:hypothetical protein
VAAVNEHVFWQHDGVEVDFDESEMVGRRCALSIPNLPWVEGYGPRYVVREVDHADRMVLVSGPCLLDDRCHEHSPDVFWVPMEELRVAHDGRDPAVGL